MFTFDYDVITGPSIRYPEDGAADPTPTPTPDHGTRGHEVEAGLVPLRAPEPRT